MFISPSNVSIPAVVPTVNQPTEQVARDNRVREKIIPPRQASATAQERAVSPDEKQLRHSSLDLPEQPDYLELAKKTPEFQTEDITDDETVNLSLSDVKKPNADNGYAMRLKLPKEVLERVEEIRRFRHTGAVVAMRYQQSSAANIPSEVLIII